MSKSLGNALNKECEHGVLNKIFSHCDFFLVLSPSPFQSVLDKADITQILQKMGVKNNRNVGLKVNGVFEPKYFHVTALYLTRNYHVYTPPLDPLELIYGCTLENLHAKLTDGNLPPKEVETAKAAFCGMKFYCAFFLSTRITKSFQLLSRNH